MTYIARLEAMNARLDRMIELTAEALGRLAAVHAQLSRLVKRWPL